MAEVKFRLLLDSGLLDSGLLDSGLLDSGLHGGQSARFLSVCLLCCCLFAIT